MKTIGAQIAELEATRKSKLDEATAIQTKAMEDGRSKDADEQEKFNALKAEVQQLDKELEDLQFMENATVTPTLKAVDKDAKDRQLTVPARPEKKEVPGVRFARLAKVKAISRMDIVPELTVAEKMYGRDSETYHIVKTGEVAPGAGVSGNWGFDLIPLEAGPVADFAEYLHNGTIIGKFGQGNVPSLRNVSFRAPLVIQTAGGTGYWVGEGKPKPLTTFDFDRTTLLPLKCANIAVLTMEHIRDSSPSSDLIVRDSLRAALVEVMDLAFIDPANTGNSGKKPVSITSGAPAIVAEANGDFEAAELDARSVKQKFITANNDLLQGVWIMSPANAEGLAAMRNDLGQYVYTGVDMRGGMWKGMPVITSNHAGTTVALVNASDIHYGNDGGVTVDMSREASLEMKVGGDADGTNTNMSQNPLGPGTGTSLVSLWQNNLVGLLAEATVNWRRRRTVSVAYLTGVAWGGEVNVS